MIALFNKLLDWFKALFWKEEMELTLVGLQYSGKTTFVNVIAVRGQMWQPAPRPGQPESPPGVAGHRRAAGREEPAPGAWGLARFLGDQLACYPFSGLDWDGRAGGGVARTRGPSWSFVAGGTERSPGIGSPPQADRPPWLTHRGHDRAKVPGPSRSARGESRDARSERVTRGPCQPSPTPKALSPPGLTRKPRPIWAGEARIPRGRGVS